MMRALSLLAATAVAGVLVTARGVSADAPAFSDIQKSRRDFNVGVLRADGVIIPFARYDRGDWRALWTGVERASRPDVPLMLDAIKDKWWADKPPTLTWHLWQPSMPPRAVRALAPVEVVTPCSTEVGLATDFVPDGSLPPFDATPYPKAGLVTSDDVKFAPIERLAPDDPDAARIAHALGPVFDREEDHALVDMHWAHPVPRRVRQRTPIDVQTIWHADKSRFYYVEAMRRYPDPEPRADRQACELVTYTAGYFWENRAERLEPAGINALISYCHMERASFMWPLGQLQEGDRTYWLYQSSGWSGEVYGVSELDARRGEVRMRRRHVAGECW